MTTDNVLQPVSLSLTPYTGTWNTATAAHLLRRTMFGATYAQIQQAVTDGMATTVSNLLLLPSQTVPLTYSPDEAVAAYGTTWINELYPSSNVQATDNARRASGAAWVMERCNQPGMTIKEKMCLFWVNHFGVDANSEAKSVYQYMSLIEDACLGNFKQLIKDVTVNPLMLQFLNGASNNYFAPNENYARELLELYTVGKGPQIGPGDYSTYTEDDVAAGARILSGYTISDFFSSTVQGPNSSFTPILHDPGAKTLSAYFGSATLTNQGAAEADAYIDIIFNHPEFAKHICRKLYRWFVNYDLTATVETTVINDMAATLVANNFEILPVMDELLKSEHFYDMSVRGAIIKNPLECLFSMINVTGSMPAYDLATNYEIYLNVYYAAATLGMDYFTPPSVGGWTAYYQTPSYSKLWANSSYIKLRFDVGAFLTVTNGIQVNGNYFKLNCLNFLDGLSVPSDPVQVIDDMITVFTPKGVSAATKLMLKAILCNGQPDFEWTVQYNDYIANPGNTAYSTPVRQRVEFTLYRLFQLPEFQTI